MHHDMLSSLPVLYLLDTSSSFIQVRKPKIPSDFAKCLLEGVQNHVPVENYSFNIKSGMHCVTIFKEFQCVRKIENPPHYLHPGKSMLKAQPFLKAFVRMTARHFYSARYMKKQSRQALYPTQGT
jgi:hypothetical protein